MTALHLVIAADGRLTIWGEERADGQGRSAASTDSELRQALDPLLAETAEPVVLTVTVPFAGTRALASTTLPAPGTGLRPAPDALGERAVAALALTGSEALDLLAIPAPDGCGDDFGALVSVAGAANELVAAGRVVPVLVEGEARWRPWPEAELLAALSAALPASVRAAAPERSATRTVRVFLDGLVDAIIRDRLRGQEPRDDGSGAAAFATALCRRDASVDLPPPVRLALEQWATPPSGPVRTCFRLDPPDAGGDDDGVWHVRFFLQSTDDPSLLVDAATIWRGDAVDPVLAQRVGDAHDHLLVDLARAAGLYAPLKDVLESAAPTELATDADGAVAFLRDGVPLLDAAGFGILAPAWWRAAARVGVKAQVTATEAPGGAARSRLGVESLVDVDWQLALGDDDIDVDELIALAQLKTPLVKVRGQWTYIDGAAVDAAIGFVQRRRPRAGLTLADALALVNRADEPALDTAGVEVTAIDFGGWIGELLAGDRRPAPASAPAAFNGELRNYQRFGVAWMQDMTATGFGVCLADDMGLGKTVQVLALLAAAGQPAHPALLVCPTSLVGNWEREAARFTPDLALHVHHGAGRARGDALTDAIDGVSMVVTTYPLCARDIEDLAGRQWSRLILDEAQHVKNPATRQARAVRSIRAPQRIALTGTPIENRLSDLWSLMTILNPGLLGSAKSFRETFSVPIERHRDDNAAERLNRLVHPFVLRRTKRDERIAPELPERIDTKVPCTLTSEQASLYASVVDELIGDLRHRDEASASGEDGDASGGIARRGRVLAGLTALKQICNHPALYAQDDRPLAGRSGKLAVLDELVDEILDAGDRALIFTQFATWGTALSDHLRRRTGRDVLYLHGGVRRPRRDEMVELFQRGDAAPPLFVLSLKAGGVGLNLTAANHVIHYDRWWNPAVEEQASDRAHRIGQRRTVQVHKLICAGTLEERIDEIIADKAVLAESIIATGADSLADLDTDDLARMVTLAFASVDTDDDEDDSALDDAARTVP